MEILTRACNRVVEYVLSARWFLDRFFESVKCFRCRRATINRWKITGNSHFTPPVFTDPIPFFFLSLFFSSVSTRASTRYHVERGERRSNGSLIIPLNGKPISRFVPRRLANTGPPMAGTKGRNWKTTSAYITESGYACIRRLDAVLRCLRDSPAHDLRSLWIISWTTRCLIRVG